MAKPRSTFLSRWLEFICYAHHNPHYYCDPEGQFAMAIPLLIGAFWWGGIVLSTPTIATLVTIAVGTALDIAYTKLISGMIIAI